MPTPNGSGGGGGTELLIGVGIEDGGGGGGGGGGISPDCVDSGGEVDGMSKSCTEEEIGGGLGKGTDGITTLFNGDSIGGDNDVISLFSSKGKSDGDCEGFSTLLDGDCKLDFISLFVIIEIG
jgi:hypothetical protein